MWKRMNNYYMENNGWTICKVFVRGKWTYELWEGVNINGYFDSAEKAKERYEELVNG